MIGDYHIDYAFVEGCPEALVIFTLTDWWGAFEFGRAIGNILGDEG
jgi:hypothetical protein